MLGLILVINNNTLLVIDNNTWLTITLCKHEQIVSYSTEHKKFENLTATEPQPFYNVLLFLRTLCTVWSPVRRRVTRRLIKLKAMYNVLKYQKTW